MQDTTLSTFLLKQWELQVNHMGADPTLLDHRERIYFLWWNSYALADELHEAMAEVGWKPWATSRHINGEAFVKELVDAWHFFLNMLLAVGPYLEGVNNIHELADYFTEAYNAKLAKNAQRQVQGYDGVAGKCPTCHREIDESNSEVFFQDHNGVFWTFCSRSCFLERTGNG